MLGTVAGHTTGTDLGSVGYILAEDGNVLPVDVLDLLFAKRTGLLTNPTKVGTPTPLCARVIGALSCH
jgi:hypothetical protein